MYLVFEYCADVMSHDNNLFSDSGAFKLRADSALSSIEGARHRRCYNFKAMAFFIWKKFSELNQKVSQLPKLKDKMGQKFALVGGGSRHLYTK